MFILKAAEVYHARELHARGFPEPSSQIPYAAALFRRFRKNSGPHDLRNHPPCTQAVSIFSPSSKSPSMRN
jgi:hypothetical protein